MGKCNYKTKQFLQLIISRGQAIYYNQMQSHQSATIQKASTRIEPEPASEEIQIIQSTKGQKITSCSVSHNRKHILITTQKGFLMVTMGSPTFFKRFQDTHSPFFHNQTLPYGVRLGYLFQTKPQVALVPNFTSKHFKQTSIYIYNHSVQIILSNFDMVLPIRQLALTERLLICSNNKRILVYNYLKYTLQDREQFYIDAHQSQEHPDFIRYIEMGCHKYLHNKAEGFLECECGKFQIATQHKQYLKLYFVKVLVQGSSTIKRLYTYDEVTQQVKPFQKEKTISDNFQFKVSQNSKYLLIAQDYGRKIKVYTLPSQQIITIFHLSRDPARILHLGLITHPQKGQFVLASRQKAGDQATMHLFQLKNLSLVPAQSKFKRYFQLYKNDTYNKGVFAPNIEFLGPQYYTVQGKVMCLSMEGEECQLIDLGRTGLHPRGNAASYTHIEEKN